jgi:hypothetical protein
MRTNYVLIDYENVKVRSLALLHEEHFHVKVFLGPNNTKVPVALVLSMKAMGQRAEFVTLKTMGRNALGFHLAYYLGSLAAVDETAFFHIISGDCGFDPLLRHLNTMNIHVARFESIERMPCFASSEVIKPAAATFAPKTEPRTVPESKKEALKEERVFADSEEAPKPAPVFVPKTEPQAILESRKEALQEKAFADSEEAFKPVAALFAPTTERQTFPFPESKEEALKEKVVADFLQRKA